MQLFIVVVCAITGLGLFSYPSTAEDNLVSATAMATAAMPVQQSLNTDDEMADQPSTAIVDSTQFTSIEWVDLMPKADLEALLNPPDYLDDIADGTVQDQLSSQIHNAISAAADDAYQQALVSTDIVAEMDGQAVRLPGFIVPLEYDDAQTVTAFFLVPYFGACIHVPPPPPNQIIFVTYPAGLKLTALYDPVWVSGVLKTTVTDNDVAVSAYSMEMYHHEAYTNSN